MSLVDNVDVGHKMIKLPFLPLVWYLRTAIVKLSEIVEQGQVATWLIDQSEFDWR